MGNIYKLYYFYPTCIASGFIYELNYLYPAPSASGKHLLLSLVYTVSLNLATCFLSLEIFFTISWLIICRNSVVKYKFKPLKLLENALFSAFYFSKLFIVGNFFNFSSLPFVMLRCAISIYFHNGYRKQSLSSHQSLHLSIHFLSALPRSFQKHLSLYPTWESYAFRLLFSALKCDFPMPGLLLPDNTLDYISRPSI